MELIASTTLLFILIMDPVGNVPLFITALQHTSDQRRRMVIVRELLIALTLMVLFLFGGQAFMRLFQVGQPALTVAGGIILMLIALRLIFPTGDSRREFVDDEPFIVPLAVPFLAGPSLLAFEIVLINRNPDLWWAYLISLVTAWLVTAVVLYFSLPLQRLLGAKALTAVERLMGMVLVIFATQMMLDGMRDYFLYVLEL